MPLFVGILSAKGIEKDTKTKLKMPWSPIARHFLLGRHLGEGFHNGNSDTSKQYRVTIGFQAV